MTLVHNDVAPIVMLGAQGFPVPYDDFVRGNDGRERLYALVLYWLVTPPGLLLLCLGWLEFPLRLRFGAIAAEVVVVISVVDRTVVFVCTVLLVG